VATNEIQNRLSLSLLKVVALIGLIAFTNQGFWQRILVLWATHQYLTIVPFLVIWGIAIVAVFVSAFHPSVWVRTFWAILIAASTAAGWGYEHISQSHLSVFEVLTLWNARHEAGRASIFYFWSAVMSAVVFVIMFIALEFPAYRFRLARKKLFSALALFPLVPIILMASVVWIKNGTGSQGLPNQFLPAALAGLAAEKLATQDIPVRQKVTWKSNGAVGTKNIILLVDESIRADYIDLTPGNRYTPNLAALADKFVNFGPASSGGNCSSFSNVILRYGVSRKNIMAGANENASLFQYAKTAGFRTVFIDAQAGNISDGSAMQNFMTTQERADIDGFYAIRDVSSADADAALAKIVETELGAGKPVFIYANKNGSHFPYDATYPAASAVFHPTMTEKGDTVETRIASYRNAIAWSVDLFMRDLFKDADLSNTTLFYTSDHGQQLDPNQLTHCQVDGPDPRMHLVPLMVYSSDPATRAKLEVGAKLLSGKASHFQIAATLYALMGYSAADVDGAYDEDLFKGTAREPATTSGDIFGLFGSNTIWNSVDLKKNYMEPESSKMN
jgi:glucan phosphoethanolaminetransferase (alkaline phosphatase superfamily)